MSLSLINDILFWILIALLLLEAYNLFCHGSVPNIRTAPSIRREIVSLIRTTQNGSDKKDLCVMDLGCGNGGLTRAIAKAMPDVQVMGLDISPLSLWIARWMQKRAKITNLTYQKQDILTANYRQADILVLYLIPPLLARVAPIILAQTRPGTLVISNKFPLKGDWAQSECRHVKTLYPHQGLLHIYRR